MADALDYLHHQCETPIVHGDLKPSNVLLDDDMVAHVGDLWLAKFVPDANEILSSGDQTNTSALMMGSIGYVAPGALKLSLLASILSKHFKFLITNVKIILHCGIRNRLLGFPSRRCVQLWHPAAGDVDGKETNRRHVFG